MSCLEDHILMLNQVLKKHIASGGKPSQISAEYQYHVIALIKNAISSNDSEEAIKHIAFLIYAGAVQDYLLPMTSNRANALTGKVNKHSGEQSERAQNSRGKITEQGETIGNLIERISLEKDALGGYVPALSLWSKLYSALDEAGTDPKEIKNNSKPRKTYYLYTNVKGDIKKIQRDTFENKITACRKKLSQ